MEAEPEGLNEQRYRKDVSRHSFSASDGSEVTEAAVAEMLLDLSHSPSNSPKAPRDDEDSQRCCRAKQMLQAEQSELLPSTRKRRSTVDWSKIDEDDSEDEETAEMGRKRGRIEKSAKRVPGRCKCGKRISAAHPPCKSELMLLCERFRDRFGHLSESGEPTRIHLNECATELGVPRRRLYDITIVYEAAEVVKRTGKLAYVWRGTAHLPELIEQLKHEEETRQPVGDRRGSQALPLQHERQTTHSLWTLSRKFIRLLLTTEGPIQLTEAAKHLIGDSGKGGKRQQTQLTVERRLYDIGSILSTLDLIRRSYVEGKRQPAFSWNWERESSIVLSDSPLNSSPGKEAMFPVRPTPLLSAKTVAVKEESPVTGAENMQRKSSGASSNQSSASEQAWPEVRAHMVNGAQLTGFGRSSPLAFGSPILQTPWSLPQFWQELTPSMRLSLAGISSALCPTAPLQLSTPHPPLQLDSGGLVASAKSTLCKPVAISAAAIGRSASLQLSNSKQAL